MNIKSPIKKSKVYTKGFTLIELLVVIAVIGILSTLAIVALSNSRVKARDSKRVSDLRSVVTALELYYANNNGYPSSLTPGQPLSDTSGTTYITKVPQNPEPRTDGNCPNQEYNYTNYGGHYSLKGCLGTGFAELPAGGFKINTGSPLKSTGPINGLVGWWLFEAGSGTTALDSSGNNNHATLYGDNVWVSQGCPSDFCLHLPTTSQYALVPNSSSINVTGQAISFGGWVNYTGMPASTILMDRNNHYRIWAKSANNIYCYLHNGSSWSPNLISAAPSTGWHHLMCVYDGINFRLYVDGVQTASISYNQNMPSNSNSLTIGRSSGGGSGIGTYLDDIRVYNRTLSADEVLSLYQATRPN
ncbi:MAG: prepilin-type N-terminal cleavage/methylation domain-containing protein [Patescibacteria group bacterium]|nr:MAG: prepilin-type N-terminal cleavage/methylation domain-containing protein [Patescibacteria group bacterium]